MTIYLTSLPTPPGPVPFTPRTQWVAALSEEDELDSRGPVSPALAGFVAEALALNTPVALCRTVDVDVAVRNKGNTPTAGYDLVFYSTGRQRGHADSSRDGWDCFGTLRRRRGGRCGFPVFERRSPWK